MFEGMCLPDDLDLRETEGRWEIFDCRAGSHIPTMQYRDVTPSHIVYKYAYINMDMHCTGQQRRGYLPL